MEGETMIINPYISTEGADNATESLAASAEVLRRASDATAAPFNAVSYALRCPPAESLPVVDECCLKPLLDRFSLESTLRLVSCLLTEQSILIHSADVSLLTPVCEALLALIYPFQWPHIYVPVLPEQLLDNVEAPVPFFMGMHSELVCNISGDCLSNIVLVRLDTGSVVEPMQLEGMATEAATVPELPLAERQSLLGKLQAAAPSPRRRDWDLRRLRSAFVDFFVTLVGRFFLSDCAVVTGASSVVEAQASLKSILKEEDEMHRRFLSFFVETLTFREFLDDCLIGSRYQVSACTWELLAAHGIFSGTLRWWFL